MMEPPMNQSTSYAQTINHMSVLFHKPDIKPGSVIIPIMQFNQFAANNTSLPLPSINWAKSVAVGIYCF